MQRVGVGVGVGVFVFANMYVDKAGAVLHRVAGVGRRRGR